MHATNVQPFRVLDALTIIATCSESSETLELVATLRTMTMGELQLPLGPRSEQMARRIGQQMRNAQWLASASMTLHNAETNYLAHQFFQWCLRCVPTNAANPLADETWLPRVRMLYSWDPNLRLLAEALVNQFRLADDNEFAVQAPATPAQSAAPAAPAPKVSTPASAHDAIHARLIARLRVVARTKRFIEQFVRDWKAQKARAATPIPVIQQAMTMPASIPCTPKPNGMEARTVKPQAHRLVQSFSFIPPSSNSANANPRVPDAQNSFFEAKTYVHSLSQPM
ncbi:MAG TPA: hypothetical protein PK156_46635 [Polyangium sp.]|nr:hypothetical protein [Polyangium sp.]